MINPNQDRDEDDWQVGDKALCVKNGPLGHGKSAHWWLTEGQVYEVTRIVPGGTFGFALEVNIEHGPPGGFAPCRFEKQRKKKDENEIRTGVGMDILRRLTENVPGGPPDICRPKVPEKEPEIAGRA